jgi:hypothetical protein
VGGNSRLSARAVFKFTRICKRAGADFQRLMAVAKARDYRPEWIGHQLENYGVKPTPAQAAILSRMIAVAGSYISRRRRWVLRRSTFFSAFSVSIWKTCSTALAMPFIAAK